MIDSFKKRLIMSDFRRPVFESTNGNETSESVFGMVKSKSCLQIINVESLEMKIELIFGLGAVFMRKNPSIPLSQN